MPTTCSDMARNQGTKSEALPATQHTSNDNAAAPATQRACGRYCASHETAAHAQPVHMQRPRMVSNAVQKRMRYKQACRRPGQTAFAADGPPLHGGSIHAHLASPLRGCQQQVRARERWQQHARRQGLRSRSTVAWVHQRRRNEVEAAYQARLRRRGRL